MVLSVCLWKRRVKPFARFCVRFCLRVALQEKLLACVGERSVTWFICTCECEREWEHGCAPQVKQEDSTTVSGMKLLEVFLLPLSSPPPHPLALSHIFFLCVFVSSLSSPVSLSQYTTSALLLHAVSSYFCISLCFPPLPSLTPPASPPDNDRKKECQIDGRRLPPGQDAGRTRSPFTR